MRQEAIKWWNEQSPEYKEQLWEQYQKENFTPSNSWETLTGREIEAIYRAISPKTRLS